MRKKITALCFLLVAMLSMSVAQAQYTSYKWEVSPGTDANGSDIWVEVTDPLGTGITLSSLSKMRITFDGVYQVADYFQTYKYLYEEDLETKVFANGISPSVKTTESTGLKTTLEFNPFSAHRTPDVPFTREGTYYFVVPENSFNFYVTEEDYKASPKVYSRNTADVSLCIKIDNDYLVTQDDATINQPVTWYFSLPTEYTITIDNADVTKTSIVDASKIALFSGKSKSSGVTCDATINADGKSIDIKLTNAPTTGSTLYVAIQAGALQFNDDATKSNNHIYFGPYVLPGNPSSSFVRDIVPAKNSKITTLDNIYFYTGKKSGTYIFDETKPILLQRYDEGTSAWVDVCEMKGVQIADPKAEIGQDYMTVKLSPASTPAEGFAYGKYRIFMPEKSVFFDASGSITCGKEYTAEYDYAAKPEIALNPTWSIEDGAEFNSLAEVYVTFAGATSVSTVSSKPIELYKKIGSYYNYQSSLKCDQAVLEGGKIKLSFQEAVAQEGEYKIELPAGALNFDGFADLRNEASVITFKVNSTALVRPSNVVITPALGEISEIPSTFTLTLNDANITSVEVGTKEVYVGMDYETWESIYETVPVTAAFKSTDAYVNHEYDIAVDPTDCKKITFTKKDGGYGEFEATKEYYFDLPTGSLIINKDAETGEYLTNDDLQLGSYYAPYEYVWEVRTGTDANGADVWTKVANPLEEGITVSALDKARLTVVGAHSVKASWNAYCYLYKSDLETKVFNNGATKTVTDNQIVFDFTGAYYTPDKPYTVNGEYCALIAENLIEIFRTAEDVTAKVSTKNPDSLGCFITIENNSLISAEDCSIDVATGWYKSMPTEFNITINNDEVLKTAIADASKVGLYSSSNLKSVCEVVISEDGKTLKLTPTTAITSSGDFYLYILANTLTFNDDATLTNNHLKFGPYTLPGSTSINEIAPKAGGKVTKLDSFNVNVRKTSGTFIFDEENVAVLNKYNDATAAWEKVSDLVATEAEGYSYKTVNYTLPEDFEGELALGKYQVSIPEKSFFLETVSSTSTSVSYNKAYTAEYELCEMPNVELLPVWDLEEGGTYSSLAETYVTFAGATSATYNSMNAVQVFKNIGGHYTYFTDANCAEYDYSTYKYVVNIEEGGRVKVTFGEELKEEGEYKIVFPAGALSFEGFTDVMNEASEIRFNIESNAPIRPSNVTITPAAGGITDFPTTFEMIIDNADITSVEVGQYQDYNEYWDLVWMNHKARFVSTDSYVTVSYDIAVDPADCKKVTFTIDPNNYYPFDPTKQYYFELPSGALLVNKDVESGEYTQNDAIAYGLYETAAMNVTPNVGSDIYFVKDFVVTSNASLTFANNEELLPVLNYEDPEFGMISPLPVTVTAVEGTDNQYVITTGMEAKTPGVYTLHIPAGAFLYNGTNPTAEVTNAYNVVVEPAVTTAPEQGDIDINAVGGSFRAVNVLFNGSVDPNPDFEGEITLAINGTIVSSVNKYSEGELYNELGILFPEKFILNGTYVVTVPCGAALYEDGRLSSSQVFTWNVSGGFTLGEGVSVDPAEGRVSSLSIVNVTFNEHEIASKNIFYNNSALAANGNVVLRDAQGNIVAECTTGDMANSEAGFNVVEIKLCEPGTSTVVEITAPGEYTMTIPAGIVNFNKNGANPCTCGECYACISSRSGVGNGNYNEELTFTWTIPNPATLVATPADGSVVESLANIVLEWQGAEFVEVNPNQMVGGAKIYRILDNEEEELVSDLICSPIGEGSNTAVLDIINIPTQDGNYHVRIPKGMFTVDGQVWEGVSLYYTIESVDVALEQISTDTFIEMLMTVTPCESIELNPEAISQITLAYLDDNITEVGYYEVEVLSGNTAKFTLSTNSELVNGDYVIWIPDGQFLFDGKPNADVKIYYEGVNIVGIEGIDMDAKNLNIYSVNGMLIKRNGSLRDLNELEPGIYVVNGQKVMVK
ncbi:MAG: hypothetical protein E7079_00275 [Bacteroidales bacterium]|nr:hypothetical protein [Bacteroidales bacterium]